MRWKTSQIQYGNSFFLKYALTSSPLRASFWRGTKGRGEGVVGSMNANEPGIGSVSNPNELRDLTGRFEDA